MNEKLLKELRNLKGIELIDIAKRAKYTFDKYYKIQSYWIDGKKKVLQLELKNKQKAEIKFRNIKNKNGIRVIDCIIKEH